MEAVPCDLCGANTPLPYLTTRDRFSGKMYDLSICANCHLVYLTPRPSAHELYDHYPEDYEAYETLEKSFLRSPSRNKGNGFLRQINYVERYQPGRGRLLDIGCATGRFLNQAKERGWQVLGIEINDNAAKFARQHYQLNALTSDLEHANLAPESQDVVTLWDVLEHLPSPKNALMGIHNILHPGGLVFFSIPNLDCYDRRIFGPEWIGWDAPRHFTLYDHASVQRLLGETGFKLIDRRCLTGGKGTFFLSIKRVTQVKPHFNWLASLYPLISLLLLPYRQYSYLNLRGPIITYAARKV